MLNGAAGILFIMTIIINALHAKKQVNIVKTKQEEYKDFGEHTMVTDSETFPYVVAILKKTTYMCTGALIDESWVITAADALFLLSESSRIIRIRLGSINYKKGGIFMPIKYFQIHPYFDDNKPQYDIALIRLAQQVRLTPNLNPIRLQSRRRNVVTTHFIVTGWQAPPEVPNSEEIRLSESVADIKRRRLLSVFHLHPTYPEECSEQLSISSFNDTGNNLMCLDPAVGTDPCERQAGAPVVLNGVLWGVVSSWKPDDCDLDTGPTYVVMVAAQNISSWIQATMHDKMWSHKHRKTDNLVTNNN